MTEHFSQEAKLSAIIVRITKAYSPKCKKTKNKNILFLLILTTIIAMSFMVTQIQRFGILMKNISHQLGKIKCLCGQEPILMLLHHHSQVIRFHWIILFLMQLIPKPVIQLLLQILIMQF